MKMSRVNLCLQHVSLDPNPNRPHLNELFETELRACFMCWKHYVMRWCLYCHFKNP